MLFWKRGKPSFEIGGFPGLVISAAFSARERKIPPEMRHPRLKSNRALIFKEGCFQIRWQLLGSLRAKTNSTNFCEPCSVTYKVNFSFVLNSKELHQHFEILLYQYLMKHRSSELVLANLQVEIKYLHGLAYKLEDVYQISSRLWEK